jgi:hypothetical protein
MSTPAGNGPLPGWTASIPGRVFPTLRFSYVASSPLYGCGLFGDLGAAGLGDLVDPLHRDQHSIALHKGAVNGVSIRLEPAFIWEAGSELQMQAVADNGDVVPGISMIPQSML